MHITAHKQPVCCLYSKYANTVRRKDTKFDRMTEHGERKVFLGCDCPSQRFQHCVSIARQYRVSEPVQYWCSSSSSV